MTGMFAISLLLAACDTEEANDQEAQAKPMNSNDKSNVEDSVFTEQEQEIGQTLASFELPQEGRLSHEEAVEQFPGGEGFEPQPDEIAFDNFFRFEEDTNKAVRIRRVNYEGLGYEKPADPYGTQALGLFMSTVEHVSEIMTNVHGEQGGSFEDLTEEDHELLQIEDEDKLISREARKPVQAKGWPALEGNHGAVDYYFGRIDPYLTDYEEIHEWTQETRQYFKEMKDLGQDNYEDAYEVLLDGKEKVDDMVKVIDHYVDEK